jgi:hypothetical protein
MDVRDKMMRWLSAKAHVYLQPVQAIVEHDKIRLFYLRNETAYQVQMKDRVVSRIRKSGSSTFEFRALEALLIAAVCCGPLTCEPAQL